MAVTLAKTPVSSILSDQRKARKEARENSLIAHMIGSNTFGHLLRNDLDALVPVLHWDYS